MKVATRATAAAATCVGPRTPRTRSNCASARGSRRDRPASSVPDRLATGALTDQQATVLQILTDQHPTGLRAIDVGHTLHLEQGKRCGCNPAGVVCRWAHGDAGDVLRALRTRDLAIQRRSGRWELLHPPVTGYDPSTAPILY